MFVDTLIICTATAMLVLLSDAYLGIDARSIDLTQASLQEHLGTWASSVLAITIFFFAFSSVIGNYYYGESNIGFIKNSKMALNIYRVFVVGFIFFGAVAKVQLVWDLADVFMGVMAIINLIAILMLWKIAKKLLNHYNAQRKAGIDPVFHEHDVEGIGELDAWKTKHQ